MRSRVEVVRPGLFAAAGLAGITPWVACAVVGAAPGLRWFALIAGSLAAQFVSARQGWVRRSVSRGSA